MKKGGYQDRYLLRLPLRDFRRTVVLYTKEERVELINDLTDLLAKEQRYGVASPMVGYYARRINYLERLKTSGGN